MHLDRTVHYRTLVCPLFESARFCRETSSFSWVDIEHALLFRMNAEGIVTTCRTGFDFLPLALPLASTNFVLASGSALHLFDSGFSQSSVWLEPLDFDQRTRFNDGGFDLSGNLWIGTMRLSGDSDCGVLYRITPNKSISIEYEGVGISNGIHWVDESNGYYVDSAARRLMRISQDSSGVLQSVKTIADWDEGEPDGIAVTSAGDIWVAVWDGKRIDRFSSQGEALECVPVSGSRPTSIAFGSGSASRSMVITFAAEPDSGVEAAKVEIFSGLDVPLPHPSYDAPSSNSSWRGSLLDQTGSNERQM